MRATFDHPFFRADRQTILGALAIGMILFACAAALSSGHEVNRAPEKQVSWFMVQPTRAHPACQLVTGPCEGDLALADHDVESIIPVDLHHDGSADLVLITSDDGRPGAVSSGMDATTLPQDPISWSVLVAEGTASGWRVERVADVRAGALRTTGDAPEVAAGDLDHDGDLELVVARTDERGMAEVLVLRNAPEGWRTETSRTFDAGSRSSGYSSSGRPQVAIGRHGSLAVQWNRTTGAERRPFVQLLSLRGERLVDVTRPTVTPGGLLVSADANRDGRDDVVNLLKRAPDRRGDPLVGEAWVALRLGDRLVGDPSPRALRIDFATDFGSLRALKDLDHDGYVDHDIGPCRWLSSQPEVCHPTPNGAERAVVNVGGTNATMMSIPIFETYESTQRLMPQPWAIGSPHGDAIRPAYEFAFAPSARATPVVADLDGDGSDEAIAAGDGLVRAWTLEPHGSSTRYRFGSAAS